MTHSQYSAYKIQIKYEGNSQIGIIQLIVRRNSSVFYLNSMKIMIKLQNANAITEMNNQYILQK